MAKFIRCNVYKTIIEGIGEVINPALNIELVISFIRRKRLKSNDIDEYYSIVFDFGIAIKEWHYEKEQYDLLEQQYEKLLKTFK